MVEEEDGITLPSCPGGRELLATSVQEALIEKQTISGVLGFHQILAFNQCLPEAIGVPGTRISCIVSLDIGWDSELQVLKGLARCRPTSLPQRRASRHTQNHPVQEKQLCTEDGVDCDAQ